MNRSARLVAGAITTTALAVTLITIAAYAAVPQMMNFQGILLDTGGGVVNDSTYVLTFRIYDDSTGGSVLWSETQVVSTENGLFNTFLGKNTPVPGTTFVEATRWLEIDLVGFGPYSPRTQLGSVAYAYRVESVNGATGGNIYGDVHIHSTLIVGEDNETTAGNILVTDGASTTIALYGIDGNVGIGTDDPGAQLHVAGDIYAQGPVTASSVFINDNLTLGQGHTNIGPFTTCLGENNIASGYAASVIGGWENRATGDFTLSAGAYNGAVAAYSMAMGGAIDSSLGNYSAVIGGLRNIARGEYACIPGGIRNMAIGDFSLAAGSNAKANHDGSVVIAANAASSILDTVSSSAGEQIVLRADSGFYLTNHAGAASTPVGRFLNTSTNAYLSIGGTWVNGSDRNTKENFAEIDRTELLERVTQLPITRWNYKAEGPNIQHIGPVAQDFAALFDVGIDDKSISSIDPSGIALAAIQELYRRTRESDARKSEEIEQLRQQITQLQEQIKSLQSQNR